MNEDRNDELRAPDGQRLNSEIARRELSAVGEIVEVLQTLPPDSMTKVLRTVSTFLGLESSSRSSHSRSYETVPSTSKPGSSAPFSEDRSLTPKEFMLQKKPMTDVERIAVLAYYLTHYRNMPAFKTIDLSKLNTEAAQIKFSNAAFATNNAANSGFLIPASNGAKQLSAGGELFVQSLPDRNAARAAMASFRRTRKSRKSRAVSSASDQESAEE